MKFNGIKPELVSAFVESWNKHNPHHKVHMNTINWGWCYQFAVLVRRVYGKQVKIISDADGIGHCWIKVGGLNFDSDNRKGTTRHLGHNLDKLQLLDDEHVDKIWSETGTSGPLDLNVIEYALKLFKKRNK